jgi:hypothetical protein
LLLFGSVVLFGQRGGVVGGARPSGGAGSSAARPSQVRQLGVNPIPIINNNSGFNTNSYGAPNAFGSITGFGNVVFPGTGHSPVPSNLQQNNFPGNFNFNNFNNFNGAGFRGGRGRGNNNGTTVVYVPFSTGGGYYGGYYQDPSMMGGYPPQQQQGGPPVVINQQFVSETARPVVRDYGQDPSAGIRIYPPQAPQDAPVAQQAPGLDDNPSYLIAFKDHTIYAAVAYWVDGDTLHYVTNHNTHNQVSLDLVDRELSDRLNRERQVNFQIPPPRN